MTRYAFASSWRESTVGSDLDSDSSSSCSSSDDDDEDEEELTYSSEEDEEEEPEHPIGFQSLGQSRYSLDENPVESMEHFKVRTGYPYPYENDDPVDHWLYGQDRGRGGGYTPPKQTYPPIESYIDRRTAPTRSLIRYAIQNSVRRSGKGEDEMNKVTQLLRAAAVIDDRRALVPVPPPRQLLSAYAHMRQEPSRAQHVMEAERLRMEAEHLEAAEGLRLLLKRSEEKARRIRCEERKREEDLQKEAEEQRRIEKERLDAEKEAEDRQRERDRQAREKVEEKKRAEEAEVKAAQEAEAKEREYVSKARKLVGQLVQLRKSVEPFEKSKAVSKRRLKMKKIVNGKLNTLAENADKIRSVAAEVSQAITEARKEDEGMKQRLEAGATDVAPEMTKGRRYFIDLLASNVIVRAQAEGFNGQRGDGFPLANMLAQVSLENKDFVLVLAAHFYTVCPTAIPALPTPSPDASEDELMESLGMLKGKDGEFETFERFLSRTEGIISLVANIMASSPPNHVLMGGHEGAIKWLSRFLSLLPEAPASPLPLLTAPVLDAFLTGAGHMLANAHADEFRKHLDTILNDIITRLDEGAVGKPSSIRLRKTVEGGFDGFKNKLPSRALAELYYGATGAVSAHGGGGSSSTPATVSHQSGGPAGAPSPFGSSSAAAAPTASPFGTATGPSQSPFGDSSREQSNQSNITISDSFGGAAPAPAPAPSPFGSSAATSSSPFGGAPAPAPAASPFGGTPAPGASPFGGTPAQAPSSFGGTPAPSASPFGQAPAPVASPFGGAPAPAASPFGGPSSSPFGAAPTPSPFGSASAPFGAAAPSPSPFGGAPASTSPSPFGGGAPAPAPSPFGAGAPAPSPFGAAPAPSSGFGNAAAQSPSPFGASAAPSPFGSQSQSVSPFGASAPSPSHFGSSAPAPATFGAAAVPSNPSPFGAAAPSPSPFGAAAPSPSPFAGAAPSPSPFGSSPSPFGAPSQSPFGSANNNQQGGGGGGGGFGSRSSNGKPRCKFFARGQCRYGTSCRFSHET